MPFPISNFGPISYLFRDIATYSLKLSIENCGKPLQVKTWSLLTTYKKSTAPYPIIPSPTPYHLPFSHNTSVTDEQTDRQTDRQKLVPQARPLRKYGRLKTLQYRKHRCKNIICFF